jgi:hypothetical protein
MITGTPAPLASPKTTCLRDQRREGGQDERLPDWPFYRLVSY